MGCLLTVLTVAIFALGFLWREAVAQARYWQAEDERHWLLLMQSWEEQRRLLGLVNPADLADWWKEGER